MASRSRTDSLGSAGSLSKTGSGSSEPDMSNPPSPSNERPIGSAGRTPSHSLLSTSPNSLTQNRKGRFADSGTSSATVGRASLSMPPPASKPSSVYRPAQARNPSSWLQGSDARAASKDLDGARDDVPVGDSAAMAELQKTASAGSHASAPEAVEINLKPPAPDLSNAGDRTSLSSLQSLGSAIYSGMTGAASAPQSTASSNAGSIKSGVYEPPVPASVPLSPALASSKLEATSSATTITDPVSVTANTGALHQVSSSSSSTTIKSPPSSQSAAGKHLDAWNTQPMSRPSIPRRSRSKHQKPAPTSTAASSAVSPSNSERMKTPPIGKVGVCALDVKARSKASRNILTRLSSNGEFDVIIFGDKVILDEDVENWPKCDYLISFFSEGFPIDKAIAYNNLRKPFVVNDLPMQKILWDRRICLRILDNVGVPTPKRVEVNRDGGPKLESARLADHLYKFSGVKLGGPEGIGGTMEKTEVVSLADDGDSIFVDGVKLNKPFVEKPTSGEDHNIHIYFPKSHHGGGGRRLFRKIGNKSSEWDDNLKVPRAITEEGSSYLYEQFLHVDNAEDIKAYTVGPDYCHAETRTSPVVDGLVRRNTHGKEIRYICKLNPEEQLAAKKIANGFGQRICGFDMLRVKNQSFVIDVNGWSFVKDNNDYYDKAARILKEMFIAEKYKRNGATTPAETNEKTLEKAPVEKTEAEKGVTRKPTISGHRSDFVKKLMKSPSMSKLRGHNPLGSHSHGTASPEVAVVATTPLSSPPTLSKEQRSLPEDSKIPSQDQLPPPAMSTEHSVATTAQASPITEHPPEIAPEPASKHAWKLKGMVSVVRHADRTPKQKYKFTFHTEPFVRLLKGHQEEVLLKGKAALTSVIDAAKVALTQGVEDPEKLNLLKTSLTRKGAWEGTKVQIKPMFRKRKPEEIKRIKSEIEESAGPEALIAAQQLTEDPEEEKTCPTRTMTRSDSLAGTTLSRFSAAENDLVLDKLQLIVKWGGEPTHSARYQCQDLGENMRADIQLMNKEALENVNVFSSSERRVTTSAQIWAASFLNQKEVDESMIKIRKDLLDDSNAAKDVMDKVKKKLKLLLREGHKAPPQFAWPANTPDPSVIVQKVAELMVFHRKVMRQNFKRLETGATASLSALNNKSGEGSVSDALVGTKHLAQAQTLQSIQSRWCCGENPELFRERWEKLFSEFCDSEKVDPSKISELYDSMKFDSLHNRQFLEWVFTPVGGPEDEDIGEDRISVNGSPSEHRSSHSSNGNFPRQHERKASGDKVPVEKVSDSKSTNNNNLAHRIGLRRKSLYTGQQGTLSTNPPDPALDHPTQEPSYFKLYAGTGQTRAKQDSRLCKLGELYKLAKVLFDFVCPQEYGISNAEKLEIGLLTSLPLLKEIVSDLEEVQASDDAKSFVYFTKESHIYTLLNCILEGGIKTKIERNAIPELDYLSTITFELYESEDKDADVFSYSIRIGITPGCHTFDPLDVQLDSKHSIGCAPRRSLTAHEEWTEVIETLRAKFHTVKLPKSFLAVNVSEGEGKAGEGP